MDAFSDWLPIALAKRPLVARVRSLDAAPDDVETDSRRREPYERVEEARLAAKLGRRPAVVDGAVRANVQQSSRNSI